MAKHSPDSTLPGPAGAGLTYVTHEQAPPINRRVNKGWAKKGQMVAPDAPRCHAHLVNGDPCPLPATKGHAVCWRHGARAPQAIAAAQVRLAMAADPLVKGLLEMANDRKNPAQRITAIKEGLERLQLYGHSVTPPKERSQGLTVNTQINTNVSGMTDAELADYRQLLAELKQVMPAQQAIEGEVAE